MNKKLIKEVAYKMSAGALVLGLMFFVPAGTLRFWQAWAYLTLLFGAMGLIAAYLIKYDPALLARRMKTGETETEQKLLIKFGSMLYFIIFLIPGLDFRFKWSAVPVLAVVIADAVFLLGYYLFFLTLKENSYASRVIETADQQKVIATGPYAAVRHPMYAAIILILGATPVCLGSYWGLVATPIPLFTILVLRILNEEKVLTQTLPGYKAYLLKTKYRLIPRVW